MVNKVSHETQMFSRWPSFLYVSIFFLLFFYIVSEMLNFMHIHCSLVDSEFTEFVDDVVIVASLTDVLQHCDGVCCSIA